tara:strand:+ start:372 stop:1169 length:798 start_codon:yes stop_codon:yes gene_type:complete
MTKIIGILNLTLDSFSDGGMYYDLDSAKKHISDMITQGADIIDLGAESTRSGFTDIDEDVQINTLLPVINFINDNYKIPISIDTRSSKVAMAFKDHNINFINDVSSGFHDNNMLNTVSELGCGFIMTHMPKEHKDGKVKAFKNVVTEINEYFIERVESCKKAGIEVDKLIIDPGIGFGKSGEDNIALLNNIQSLKSVHKNVCIGSSNKKYSSRLFKNIQTKEDLKIANLATFATSILSKATYLRVHDVELTKDSVQVINKALSLI